MTTTSRRLACTRPAPAPRSSSTWPSPTLTLAAMVLASCGGGGGSATHGTTVTGSAVDGTVAGATTPAAASPKTPPSTDARPLAADTGWTTIAGEGQPFYLPGTRTVRYGAGSAWIARTVTDGGDCSNEAFGRDPLFGVVKSCQVAADTAGDAAQWTTIAVENTRFAIAGTQTVRYGDGTTWIARSFTDQGDCSNAAFGNDPLVGVVKRCQVAAASIAPTWTRLAGEGEGFVVDGVQTVRYGDGGSWVTKPLAGAGSCTNEFFGNDPLAGVVKHCEVAASAPAPAPAPSPAPAPAPSPAPDPAPAPAPSPIARVCTPPTAAVDTSGVAATVGTGTPASCTESALRAAVAAHAVVTFNCGAAPTTIAISSTIDVPPDRDTVIDGGHRVTLDGGGVARILSLAQPNYRTNTRGLTLQRIALRNGRAPGGGYVAPNPSNPGCAYGYASGAGAAIEVRDARLHVIDVEFSGNAAATPGPDVGGGAIYAAGSLDVVVSGSRFSANSGSNSGAIGMLQSNLRVYNSAFDGNSANGAGQNYRAPAVDSCPGIGHPGQGGAGGNAGAIGIDGIDDTDVVVCGSSFTNNRANELGGALARSSNGQPRRTTIDRSRFDGNTATQAGAVFVVNSAPLEISASTFSANRAAVFGALQLASSRFTIVNTTFSGNESTLGLAGALYAQGNGAGSEIRNATFADNRASGGPGYFAAALFGDLDFPIVNTVFADNTSADPWNPMQCGFNPASGSGDVQWPALRAVGGLADTACVAGIAFADPQLGPLADHGGPTPTRAPAASSALRNAGRNCPPTDQRGNARSAASCTVGAVE